MLDIRQGDCIEVMRTLDAGSVHCVVTSPPYWGLRDYGTAIWDGGDVGCGHAVQAGDPTIGSTLQGGKKTTGHQREGFKGTCPRCGAIRVDDQLGLEPTPEEYVEKMVTVFREVRRVLRDDGTVWLNLGDSYTSGGRDRRDTGDTSGIVNHADYSNGLTEKGARPPTPAGLKPKDLVGIPWRVAFALQADGWWLRSDIIWAKPNPMPESVRDRPTRSHEYVFLLSKSARYYFDQDAVRLPGLNPADDVRRLAQQHSGNKSTPTETQNGLRPRKTDKQRGHGRRHDGFNDRWDAMAKEEQQANGANIRSVWSIPTQPFAEAHFATFPEALVKPCILAGSPEGGTVLDPFGGSGTVGVVAQKAGRSAILIDLNPEYVAMMNKRLAQRALPLGEPEVIPL